MDFKLSKIINDSKWKSGQAKFFMQLKIKYFVNDIALLRFIIHINKKKIILVSVLFCF